MEQFRSRLHRREGSAVAAERGGWEGDEARTGKKNGGRGGNGAIMEGTCMPPSGRRMESKWRGVEDEETVEGDRSVVTSFGNPE